MFIFLRLRAGKSPAKFCGSMVLICHEYIRGED
jgi:hypothetical protein